MKKASLDEVRMVRHAACVAIVAKTIATLASPPIPSLALVFVMSF